VRWAVFPRAWRDIVSEAVDQRRVELAARPGSTCRLLTAVDGTAIPRAADLAGLVVPLLHQLSGQAVTFHALRRGAANLLLARGVDVRSIAIVLGHASVWSTLWYLQLVTETIAIAPAAPVDSVFLSAHALALLAGVNDSTAWRWLQAAGRELTARDSSRGTAGFDGRARAGPRAAVFSLAQGCALLNGALAVAGGRTPPHPPWMRRSCPSVAWLAAAPIDI